MKVSPAGNYLLEVADFANTPLLSEVIDRGDRPVVSSSEVIVYRIPPNTHTTKRRSRTSRPCTRTDMRELINAALQIAASAPRALPAEPAQSAGAHVAAPDAASVRAAAADGALAREPVIITAEPQGPQQPVAGEGGGAGRVHDPQLGLVGGLFAALGSIGGG